MKVYVTKQQLREALCNTIKEILSEYAHKDADFEVVSDFNDGVAVVRAKDESYPHGYKYNYINQRNELISPEWFVFAYEFNNGYGAVAHKDGKMNFINSDGHLMFTKEERPDECYEFQVKGLGSIMKDGKFNFVFENGQLASPYLWFDDIEDFHDGCACVCVMGTWNYIDSNGKFVSKHKWFDNLSEWDNDHGEGYIGDTRYYIDEDEVISYDELRRQMENV